MFPYDGSEHKRWNSEELAQRLTKPDEATIEIVYKLARENHDAGNPLAWFEAIIYSRVYDQVPPHWSIDACAEFISEAISRGVGADRGAGNTIQGRSNSYWKRSSRRSACKLVLAAQALTRGEDPEASHSSRDRAKELADWMLTQGRAPGTMAEVFELASELLSGTDAWASPQVLEREHYSSDKATAEYKRAEISPLVDQMLGWYPFGPSDTSSEK